MNRGGRARLSQQLSQRAVDMDLLRLRGALGQTGPTPWWGSWLQCAISIIEKALHERTLAK